MPAPRARSEFGRFTPPAAPLTRVGLSIFLANGFLSVRDRRDRDLALVRAQNPGLNDVAVEQQLVRGDPECVAGVGR